MLFEDVAGEEEVGPVLGIGFVVLLLGVGADDALKLLVIGHQAVFRAKDPEVVLEGAGGREVDG